MPFIQIYMAEGRTPQQKREIAQVVTKEVARIAKAKEENVKIYFFDLKPENMAAAGTLRIDEP